MEVVSFVVSVDQNPQANSAAEYLAIYKQKLAQIYSSDGVSFNSNTSVSLGGVTGFQINYIIHFPTTPGGDCPSREVTLYNSMAYIVSLGDCNAQEANSYLTTFNNFAASFVFLSSTSSSSSNSDTLIFDIAGFPHFSHRIINCTHTSLSSAAHLEYSKRALS